MKRSRLNKSAAEAVRKISLSSWCPAKNQRANGKNFLLADIPLPMEVVGRALERAGFSRSLLTAHSFLTLLAFITAK